MIKAVVGAMWYVTGKRIATVATGPRPGRIPIIVPIRQPIRQNQTLTGVKATSKPRAKPSKMSIILETL
jgi:hypothetical protein